MYFYWGRYALPKKTLNIIVKTENEAILQVKENQKFLLKDCQELSNGLKPDDVYETRDKKHGRIEIREAKIYNALDPEFSINGEWQDYIKTVIKITRNRSVFNTKKKEWETSIEDSFYISTMITSAEVLGKVIKGVLC